MCSTGIGACVGHRGRWPVTIRSLSIPCVSLHNWRAVFGGGGVEPRLAEGCPQWVYAADSLDMRISPHGLGLSDKSVSAPHGCHNAELEAACGQLRRRRCHRFLLIEAYAWTLLSRRVSSGSTCRLDLCEPRCQGGLKRELSLWV